MGKSEKDKAVVNGMPRGTANAHLRKKIIFEFLRMMERNVCCRCNEQIDLAEDLAIEHLRDWKDNHELFWMFDNVAFSHLDCGSGAARRERKKTMLIEVKVEDTKGNPLPACIHEGQVYVAGEKGERYNIYIKNLTSERLEVVATVDGRDVVSGEPGAITRTGYALSPYAGFQIKGFRQSNEKVAAFRFSEKGGSYSAKMGTPENVGVIGVAVFREKPRPPVIWDIHHHHHHDHHHDYWPRYPYITWHHDIYHSSPIRGWNGAAGMPSGTYTSSGGGGGGTYSSNAAPMNYSCDSLGESDDGDGEMSVNFSAPAAGSEISDVNCSAANLRSVRSDRLGRPGAVRRRSKGVESKGVKTKGLIETQKLGTEYGESIRDQVFSTIFERLSTSPDEIWSIRYDSMRQLQKKGVPINEGCQVVTEQLPNPFPNTPYVAPGFAKAPPR